MFKSFSLTLIGTVSAQMGANGYSRGVPPVTQSCNGYPLNGNQGNWAAQDVAWGLVIDREFGGCRCADVDEMEFGPDPVNYQVNTWTCRCLNDDMYPSMPQKKYICNGDGSL